MAVGGMVERAGGVFLICSDHGSREMVERAGGVKKTKKENSFLTYGGNGVRHMGKMGCVVWEVSFSWLLSSASSCMAVARSCASRSFALSAAVFSSAASALNAARGSPADSDPPSAAARPPSRSRRSAACRAARSSQSCTLDVFNSNLDTWQKWGCHI